MSAYDRAYYQEHKEKKKAYRKRWYKKNKKRASATNKEWHKRKSADPEFRQKAIERAHKWYQENPERATASRKAYAKKNKIVIRGYHRENQLKHRYGITSSDFQRMLDDQGNKCKACGIDLGTNPRHRHIDHCHVTGRVRGILCIACNLSLGSMKENAVRLFALARYAEIFCSVQGDTNEKDSSCGTIIGDPGLRLVQPESHTDERGVADVSDSGEAAAARA